MSNDWTNWERTCNNGTSVASWKQRWVNGVSRTLDKFDSNGLLRKSPKDSWCMYSRDDVAKNYPLSVFGGTQVWPVRVAKGKARLVDVDIGIDLVRDSNVLCRNVSNNTSTLSSRNEKDILSILQNNGIYTQLLGQQPPKRTYPQLGAMGKQYMSRVNDELNALHGTNNQVYTVCTADGEPIELPGTQFEIDHSIEDNTRIGVIEAKLTDAGVSDIISTQVVFPIIFAKAAMQISGRPKEICAFVVDAFPKPGTQTSTIADIYLLEQSAQDQTELSGWLAKHISRVEIN
jgi:hypothetical protein